MKTDNLQQLPTTPQPPIASENSEETLDLGRLLRTIGRKWWLILGVTAVTTAAAAFKVLSETPTYVGRFEVLVQQGSAETNVIADVPETFSGGESSSKAVVDEDLLKILKSPKVLAPLVEDIQKNYPQLCEVSEGTDTDALTLGKICYEIIAGQLGVQALDDALDEESTIVQVLFRDENPEVVQFVLDRLAQSYLDYSLEIRQADIKRGIDFVEQKLPDLRNKVNNLQNQLQTLRRQNNLIDPTSKASQLSEQIGGFSKEQQDVEVELGQITSVADELTRQLSSSAGKGASSSALNNNPRYQTLLGSLLELDSEIAEASTIYLDTSPDMQVLQEKKQNLLALLDAEGAQSQREIVSQIQELEARKRSLQQTLERLDTDVDQLTDVTRSYDEIQRELEISTLNLNQFIAKREALEIDAAQREIPWELVTPPTIPQPVTDSLLKYLALGAGAGLLLGVAIALLLDESAGVIYSEEDLKRSTGLPVIASIPAPALFAPIESRAISKQYASVGKRLGLDEYESGYDANGGGVLPSYARSPFEESFRSLYTNLRLISPKDPIRAIAISSVMADEGKSTVALHLAQAAAAVGQRVLLVDADLRNPQLHNYLDLSNEKGLTNLFSGESNPALIQKSRRDSNLYVIAAGSAPFDPAKLFSSRSMQRFTEKVRKTFDLVIYDTPPLLGQSDAYLVADYTDGMLLVTRPGKLKQSLLERAMEQLRIADINMLGLVNRED